MIASDTHVFGSPELLAEGLADAFVGAARDAVAARGSFSVALAGGNTPRAAHVLLAEEPRRSLIAWSEIDVFFGDERCVPPSDDRSNFAMAKETLLDRVPISRDRVYRMRGEIDPQRAALDYARLLRDRFGDVPHLDLVMLGMGADGHTASLFPGEDPFSDDDALVRAVYVPAAPAAPWRLTLTPRVLNGSREIIFGVSGKEKARAWRAVRDGAYDPRRYPAQAVTPHGGRILWYADVEAARAEVP